MNSISRCLMLALLSPAVVGAITGSAEAQTLTLAEAEMLALRDDPKLAGLAARAAALDDAAVADGQLPDPRIRAGIMNWPIQTFDRKFEPMNRFDIGVRQVFPRGDTLALRTQRSTLGADAERARHRAESLQMLHDLRLDWLEAYYWDQALVILHDNQTALANIIETTQFLYSTGRRNQRDVLRAKLELKLLQDREIEINRRREQSRAAIGKWIGRAAAFRPLPPRLPPFAAPPPLAALERRLADHPVIAVAQAELQFSHTDIELANQGYKPEWSLDLNYGFRGSDQFGNDRSDLFSVMVSLDVPLFTGNRQDRRVSAARHAAAAATYRRDDQLRDLMEQLHDRYAAWRRFDERSRFYRGTVIPDADDTLAASLRAYRNDIADFTAVMRDQIASFDSRLALLRLEVDRAKTRVNLFYLEGQPIPELQQ